MRQDHVHGGRDDDGVHRAPGDHDGPRLAECHGGGGVRESDCGRGRHRRPARCRSCRRNVRRRGDLPGSDRSASAPDPGRDHVDDRGDRDRGLAAAGPDVSGGPLGAGVPRPAHRRAPGAGTRRVAVLLGLPQAVARPAGPRCAGCDQHEPADRGVAALMSRMVPQHRGHRGARADRRGHGRSRGGQRDGRFRGRALVGNRDEPAAAQPLAGVHEPAAADRRAAATGGIPAPQRGHRDQRTRHHVGRRAVAALPADPR